jgi:exodeoxyribonuclease-3
MRIVTWNVNSVRARHDHLIDFLEEHKPDVLCLQELKCVEEQFPFEEVTAAGYEAAVYGQKSYNGVAILSRVGLENVRKGFEDGDEEDAQSRIVRADCGGVRILNVYVPNGESLESDKYTYKLGWLARLKSTFEAQEDVGRELVLVGDFNIVTETRDMWNPDAEGNVFTTDAERAGLQAFKDWGLTDCHRLHDESDGLFTWWDYRMLAYPKRRGLRIDLVLASKTLTARSKSVVVERAYRKRKKPSDHAPVVADFYA